MERNKPVVWHVCGLMMSKANLGDGVVGELYIGAEDTETTLKISDGVNAIYRQIPYDWLENWTLAREEDTSASREQMSEEYSNQIKTKD